jgi:hypothetical protein
VSISTAPAQGTATVNGSNQVVFTPNGLFSGNATFQYATTDADSEVSTPATVTVTVAEKLPVAVADTAQTDAGTPTAPINVLANDTIGSGTLAQQVVTIKTNGGDGNCTVFGQTVIYTPNSGFSGDDQCIYTLTDADGDSSSAPINITVHAPLSLGGGSSLDPVTLGILLAGMPLVARRRSPRAALSEAQGNGRRNSSALGLLGWVRRKQTV